MSCSVTSAEIVKSAVRKKTLLFDLKYEVRIKKKKNCRGPVMLRSDQEVDYWS